MQNNSEHRKAFEARLISLSQAYVAGLPQRFAELHNTLAQRNDGRVSAKGHQQLRCLAHTLAGSAETFGLMKLGASARALEAVVVDGVGDPQHRAA